MEIRNYFLISCDGVEYTANNSVTEAMGAAFANSRAFSGRVALGGGTALLPGALIQNPIANIATTVADNNFDPWDKNLFVVRVATFEPNESVEIRSIGLTDDVSSNPVVVTHAVFDTPIIVSRGTNITITAHLYLSVDDDTNVRLTRGDNRLVRAMLGVEALSRDGWGIHLSDINLPDVMLYRNVPEDAVLDRVSLAVEGNTLVIRYRTRQGSHLFEMILCHNRVPVARINFRSTRTTGLNRMLQADVDGIVEVILAPNILMGATLISVNGVVHQVTSARMSWTLNPIEQQNFPFILPANSRCVTSFDTRFLVVFNQDTVMVFDTIDGIRPLVAHNVEVDDSSQVAVAASGNIFVSTRRTGGSTLTAYVLESGSYSRHTSMNVPAILRLEASNNATFTEARIAAVYADNAAFFRWGAAGFGNITTISLGLGTNGRMFFHHISAVRMQYWAPFSNISGEIDSNGNNSTLTPQFVSVPGAAAFLTIGALVRMWSVPDLVMFRSSGGHMHLYGTHLTTPVNLGNITWASIRGLYNGRYMVIDRGSSYDIGYVNVGGNTVRISVQGIPKGAGFADLAVCGQWIIFVYNDGTTRLYASRLDGLRVQGPFLRGQPIQVMFLQRVNISNSAEIDISLSVRGTQ